MPPLGVQARIWSIKARHIPEQVVPGRRLGRHVWHDSRSLAYLYQRRYRGALLNDTFFERHGPILDQGEAGSCTGNAEVGELACDPFFATLPAMHPTLDETLALYLYSAAEDIDGDGPYPPNDNGSSGLSVMKAAQKRGLISGYQHITSLSGMLDALQDRPVIVGVNWYDSFDGPDSSGYVTISRNAQVRGGHEFLVRGGKIADRRLLADNSWGEGWGVRGSFEFSFATMERLLAEDGDCTVAVALDMPAPQPEPLPVPAWTADASDLMLWHGSNWQGAGAWCRKERVRPDLVELQDGLRKWAVEHGIAL